MRRSSILVLVLVAGLAVVPWMPAVAGPGHDPWTTDLPAPFADWDVTVIPDPEDEQVVELAFDSPLLGRRAISHVYLPARYFNARQPLPVAYFLHGTIRVHTEANPAFDALAEQGVNLGYPFFPGADGRTPTRFVRDSLDQAEYVIVTPDSGPEPWCGHCFFVDGYTSDSGVAAESHLYEELLPLVEAVFRVRDDRAGRAIFGRSMGGGAALIHGFRHPDRYAFVGALSPAHVDWVRDPFGHVLWKFYVQDQGYPAPQADEITWRDMNPADLATNALGTNQRILIVMGDGCVEHAEGLCEGSGPADSPNGYFFGAGQEIPLRRNADHYIPGLLQQGVPITYIQREGLHGELNQPSYEQYLLPAMNEAFAEGTPTPHRVSYRSAQEHFAAWGYEVEVTRDNREFLHLLGARLDGRELLVAGTGDVTVTTPAAFQPHRPYTVELTPLSPIPPLGRDPTTLTLTADGDGRLVIPVELAPTRQADERSEAVAAGEHPLPQVSVRVRD